MTYEKIYLSNAITGMYLRCNYTMKEIQFYESLLFPKAAYYDLLMYSLNNFYDIASTLNKTEFYKILSELSKGNIYYFPINYNDEILIFNNTTKEGYII